jgi:hypothetical protein
LNDRREREIYVKEICVKKIEKEIESGSVREWLERSDLVVN